MVETEAAQQPAQLRIAEDAVVSKDVEIVGPHAVEIGPRCVVQPRSRLVASHGPVIIGAECIVEELVVIQTTPEHPQAQIGSRNLLKVGCKVQGASVGDNNTLDIRANVGPGCVVGNGCTVGATATLATDTQLADNHAAFCVDGETRIHAVRPAQEDHILLMERHLSSLLDDDSKSALRKHHKLLSPTAS
ncbi:Dynactin subunit 6 [Hondaea fermentalgiana]|uniref:Dynactin subunit 6 n=1 Tax=Hondaea fermentalgiana TaxID=2315210 RepID=A0A2R5G7Q5_9STRA|nr:Dynactin subunit 6 [Hondaea fermentalgiana]|eukprot:GBG24513.1 Dynactin subunit 6 [Hondaea fermentalgiana]